MLKRILVLDFDGTITTSDTTSIIGQSVYNLKSVPVAWTHYTKIYEECYIPKPENLAPDAWKVVCDYERASRRCELSSINELELQDHFKDVVIKDLLQLVKEKVDIRPGLQELMQQYNKTYVLSLNWSKDLIHDLTGISKSDIYCNELKSRDGEVYSGQFTKQILTGWDKYEMLKEICDLDKVQGDQSITYIGDSFGDLPCILAKEVDGYIIGDRLKHLDIDVPTIQRFDEVKC
ncbi:Cto1p [Kluyveromyces lactis]|uniref:KLLA0A11044p n=1 Tax=Kluyveromyces lactis (strain ATCC 8585 / CBS 2359 / DSM 70799 / NBRC 1267 / NRRL Y-1140 / WM37) TaxID=284590 RepID=Q6CX58_KLULA|nr:uncharacterized protein KLLA0_A11044g [Kluyveromyces lactis]CAH03069.1 KLLA0A11044p [Kluyveromyces lactis]|eukprot:XP_451481.1 uncharacterized protein KLLA0_A11044g [Kluyveromyces lactis]